MNMPTTFSTPLIDSQDLLGETMAAVTQDRYGSTDVLELRAVEMPRIASDEVLVEVHAGGIDRGVCHLMTGQPYLIRIAGYGLRKPKNATLGLDVAGLVVAIGADVTRFQTGDEVFGIAKGSYAQYASADQNKLAHKPQNATYEQVAVAAVSGVTALEALTDVGHLQADQKVLIIGASGGVGTYAVQLAKALGAEVTGVGGAGSTDMMTSIGADHVIDYTQQDFVEGQTRYDLVLDIGGRNSIRRLRSVLAQRGTLVIVGGEGGNRLTGGVGRQLRARALSPFTAQRLTTFISSENYTNIERLAAYIESGEVVSAIGHRFGLAQVPAALRHLDSSSSRGKTVIVKGENEAE